MLHEKHSPAPKQANLLNAQWEGFFEKKWNLIIVCSQIAVGRPVFWRNGHKIGWKLLETLSLVTWSKNVRCIYDSQVWAKRFIMLS